MTSAGLDGSWAFLEGQTVSAKLPLSLLSFEQVFKNGWQIVESSSERAQVTDLGDMDILIASYFHSLNGGFTGQGILGQGNYHFTGKLQTLANMSITMNHIAAVLVVTVTFTNKAPFDILGRAPVRPEVSVEFLDKTMVGFKISEGILDPVVSLNPQDGDKRKRTEIYTLPLVVKGVNDVRVFDLMKLFSHLAGYYVLYAASAAFTKFLAMYVLPEKAEYTSLVTEMSKD
eukprot:CAMPEP_0180518874 /NCGR_PEP_ID=MMETSP1036_2-20121128/55357_1 /TAXON_ID=632150 /ORGANISM="Azadinium spinosum, Strain 3D9" /LENGTH=229 /DNA_ID=CAMNT_0022531115 /DNA_START=177 /DNA_END=863 /DNA_ORIENTATION=+